MAGEFSIASKARTTVSLPERTYQAALLMMLVTTLLSVAGFRLWQLQIVQGNTFRNQAEENRIRLIPVPADRGLIVDRQQEYLATNRLSRAVYLWPRAQSPEQWQAIAFRLGKILSIPTVEILEKLSEVGYQSAMPIRITRDLKPAQFVSLAEYAETLPGVEVQAESTRNYPHRTVAAHVLGYIGEANAADLRAHPEYPMGMIVGQMGIERSANAHLAGKWGNRLIEVNAKGKELRVLGIDPPQGGAPLHLTLDLKMQRAAEQALGGRRGAVVALDARTGAVRVLASSPSFDPNLFTKRMTAAQWQSLQSADEPLLNRALQGYPPGSTFKIVTSVAGMMSGKFSPQSLVGTSSFITVGGIQFWEHSGGYGTIGFRDALAYSSNTFFYRVGMAAGPEQIAKWSRELGIGTTSLTRLGLDGGSSGSIPTPAEKESLYGEPWYAGDTVSMSIGQGLVLVTPLELAVMVATIANGGARVQPHLLTAQTQQSECQPLKTAIAPEVIAVIREGLIDTVRKGTARRLNDGSIPLTGGKTGTAEVPGGQRSNAVFVGFGPASNPELAVAVVVENGGYGGATAAPIALAVYRAYFGKV
ncbi:penicillin-binding protein 2 [Trichothermofontia sp.]